MLTRSAPDEALPRVVLVTGASSGIGRATALGLARPGAVLALVARGRAGLDDVAAECRAKGARTSVHALDVGDDDAVAACVAEVVSAHGRLDACVHAAAVVAYGALVDVPTEVYDRVLRTDVLGTANVSRHVLRTFHAQGDGAQGGGRAPGREGEGTLVLLGSVLGRIAAPGMSSYAVSKWAVRALARHLQVEERSRPGVHVKVVSPGGVETPVYRRAATYLGRHGRVPPPVYAPETVADRVLRVLASPAAARRETQVGWGNPFLVAGFAVAPALYDALVTPLFSVLALDRRQVESTDGNVLAPSQDADPDGDQAPARRRSRTAR